MSNLRVNPDERIMGAEMEWCLIDGRYDVSGPEANWLGTIPDLYQNPFPGILTLPETDMRSRVFVNNGARWYQDTSRNAEYATPECAGADQLTLYVEAGDEFVARAVGHHLDATKKPTMSVHKRVTDFTDQGNAQGFHQNYDMHLPEALSQEHLDAQLAAFCISLIPFNGAGHVMEIEGRPTVVPAQKARFVDFIRSTTTTNARKPWIVIRQDEHNGGERNRIRKQVVSGDPNVNSWATRFTLMATSIFLRLLENGISMPYVTIGTVKAATYTAAHDETGKMKVTLLSSSGAVMHRTPIELQEYYVEQAIKMKDEGIFSPSETAFLDEWRQAIDEFKADKTTLADAVDWIAKTVACEKKDLTSLTHMRALDLAYSALMSPKISRGIGFKMRDRGSFRHSNTNEAIEHAIFNAPESTRAATRGELITIFNRIRRGTNTFTSRIDWEMLQFDVDNEVFLFQLRDPGLTPPVASFPKGKRALSMYESLNR